MLSGVCGEWGPLVTLICRLHEKTLTEIRYKGIKIIFRFSSYVGVVLGGKRFHTYIARRLQIPLVCSVMAGVGETELLRGTERNAVWRVNI
jgi:hypothetical protein